MWLLILGVIATVGFAAIVLVGIPHALFLNVAVPEQLEPYTESQLRGREVYIANGCVYCHSQQIRDAAFTTDVLRGWGDRPTVPSDYVYDRPHLLGTMRTGPDLINVGARLPDPNWHLIHLYDPRAVVEWSIMPAFPFLFELKDPGEVTPDDRLVPIRGDRAPEGKVVVATPDALALVDYLLSLRRNYPIRPPQGGRGDGTADAAVEGGRGRGAVGSDPGGRSAGADTPAGDADAAASGAAP
ncbi:MAG TPA: cbb3-type cytochrome c oxidase subunit II [Longimicrobiales bacterium]